MSPNSPEKMTGPMRPEDAVEAQRFQIPEEVFVVFNGLIARDYREGRARVMQKEVVDRLVKQGIARRAIFDNHWLDVEANYRAEGWHVTYDSPAYCEDFEPSFEFSTK